jgi:hypothetical protein
MNSLYDIIVGTQTNTNEGLARLLGLILLFVAAGGAIFWALG